MKIILNRFMSLLGYVPAPTKTAATSIPLAFEIDITQIRETLVLLEQMAPAALAAEAALAKLWNIQAAMQYRPPYTRSGGVSGSSGRASAAAPRAER